MKLQYRILLMTLTLMLAVATLGAAVGAEKLYGKLEYAEIPEYCFPNEDMTSLDDAFFPSIVGDGEIRIWGYMDTVKKKFVQGLPPQSGKYKFMFFLSETEKYTASMLGVPMIYLAEPAREEYEGIMLGFINNDTRCVYNGTPRKMGLLSVGEAIYGGQGHGYQMLSTYVKTALGSGGEIGDIVGVTVSDQNGKVYPVTRLDGGVNGDGFYASATDVGTYTFHIVGLSEENLKIYDYTSYTPRLISVRRNFHATQDFTIYRADRGASVNGGEPIVMKGDGKTSVSQAAEPVYAGEKGYKVFVADAATGEESGGVAPGKYRLIYVFPQTKNYKYAVLQAEGYVTEELGAPSGLVWNGDTAAWTAVANAAGYRVQLYRAGAKLGEPVTTHAASLDLAAVMNEAGSGEYAFDVAALGDGAVYLDGATSARGPAYAYARPRNAVKVTLRLDGAAYAGRSLELYDGAHATALAESGAAGEYARSDVPNGLYQLRADGADTGVNISVHGFDDARALDFYTVSFGACGDAIVLSGQTASPPIAPGKEGHTFAGWLTEAGAAWDGSAPITARTVLHAAWTVNSYTLTWDTDGAATVETYAYGADITPPADPVKIGYTFAGWAWSVPVTVMPAENVTATAQWTPHTYVMTWDVDGVTATENIDCGAPITPPPTPGKPHFDFVGWSYDCGGVPLTMPAKDVTATAVWTPTMYRVKYYTSDIDVYATQEYAFGVAITLPADPSITGLDFTGWDWGEAGMPASMPDTDIEAYAAFEYVRYTLSFDTDGGSLVTPQTYLYGDDIVLPGDPTRDGHAFAGWELSGQPAPTTMPARDITLTARWIAD